MGNKLGGHGRYGWSLLGAGIGASLSAGFVAGAFAITSAAYAPRYSPTNPSLILPNDGKTVSDVSAVIAVVASATLPVIGATLGYELSSRDTGRGTGSSENRVPPRSSVLRVVPTASVSSTTATVGIAGVF